MRLHRGGMGGSRRYMPEQTRRQELLKRPRKGQRTLPPRSRSILPLRAESTSFLNRVRPPQTANASFLTLSSRRRSNVTEKGAFVSKGEGSRTPRARARGHPSIHGFAATQDEAERTFSTSPRKEHLYRRACPILSKGSGRAQAAILASAGSVMTGERSLSNTCGFRRTISKSIPMLRWLPEFSSHSSRVKTSPGFLGSA